MSPPVFRKDPPPHFKDFYPLVLFLAFYFLGVLACYKDFGVDWDEFTLYSRGSALFQYLFGGGWNADDFLKVNPREDGWALYNYWYPMLLGALNKNFSLEYFHWLNLFSVALIFTASYLVLFSYYRDPWAGLSGPVFLFLTPRFLGYCPFDSKDVSFAVFYFLALSAIFLLRAKNSIGKILILGFLFGAAQSLRVIGLSLYLIWALFYAYEYLSKPHPRQKGRALKPHLIWAGNFAAVLAFSFFWMSLTWPYLRQDFLAHLVEFLRVSSRFPMEVKFLFMGHLVSSVNLPWYYLPVWFLVSTPLFILFFLGGGWIFTKKPGRNGLFVFILTALAVNLALVFVLKPAVYTAMRHFLYLMPLAALAAGLSAYEFFKNEKRKILIWAAAVLALLNAALVASHMVRLHPYEYVYFNELTGGLPGAYGRFEIEERGTSAKEAVEWLEKNKWTDPGKTYHVTCYQEPFQLIYYLPSNVKYEREWGKADTLVSLPYSGEHRFKNPILHSIEREGVPLMDIYGK